MKEGKKLFAIVVASLMIFLNTLHIVCTKILILDVSDVTSVTGGKSDLNKI